MRRLESSLQARILRHCQSWFKGSDHKKSKAVQNCRAHAKHPRCARTHGAALCAARELEEGGLPAATLDAISARSGVGIATLVQALAQPDRHMRAEALGRHVADAIPLPDTGSARGDLTEQRAGPPCQRLLFQPCRNRLPRSSCRLCHPLNFVRQLRLIGMLSRILPPCSRLGNSPAV